MEAAEALIVTYFENRPCDVVQDIYRSSGLKCYDYWEGELRHILIDSCLVACDEVPEYYRKKYPGPKIWIRDMDADDKKYIFNRFVIELGMYPGIFPFSLKDFQLPAVAPRP